MSEETALCASCGESVDDPGMDMCAHCARDAGFMVFGFNAFYPRGGWYDLLFVAQTRDGVTQGIEDYIDREGHLDVFQVVDPALCQIVSMLSLSDTGELVELERPEEEDEDPDNPLLHEFRRYK